MKKAKLILRVAAFILLALGAFAQLTIDATGPQPNRKAGRSGSFGTIGRKLPVKLTVKADVVTTTSKGTVVEFRFENTGAGNLVVPVSQDFSKLENADAKGTYSLSCLRLNITSNELQTEAVLPETVLCGNSVFPETVVRLAPNESLRVLARIKFPPDSATLPDGKFVFVAHAYLEKETTRRTLAGDVSDSQEIGSATSAPYSPRALFGPSVVNK